jgi:hypothetical protein
MDERDERLGVEILPILVGDNFVELALREWRQFRNRQPNLTELFFQPLELRLRLPQVPKALITSQHFQLMIRGYVQRLRHCPKRIVWAYLLLDQDFRHLLAGDRQPLRLFRVAQIKMFDS